MKTPKREHIYPLQEDIRNERARWKRKNRITQYKRTIAALKRNERRKKRLEKLLGLYRRRVSCLKWEIKDTQMDLENESTAATAWEERYYRLMHMAHGYCSASTCGHDIEGS